jgi:hypothetical protein
MEPPSSNAEALRRQEPAQVRASHGLLVQPMNSATSNAVISLFGSPLLACGASAAPRAISAVCAESVYVILLIGSSAQLWHRTLLFDAEFNGDEPSR